MKRSRVLAAATAGVMLVGVAACSVEQLAATATVAAVSPETVIKLQGYCRSGRDIIRLGQLQGISSTAGEIAGAVGGYCDQLLAGTVPATTDGNTVNWLPQNLSGLGKLIGFNF